MQDVECSSNWNSRSYSFLVQIPSLRLCLNPVDRDRCRVPVKLEAMVEAMPQSSEHRNFNHGPSRRNDADVEYDNFAPRNIDCVACVPDCVWVRHTHMTERGQDKSCT
jgi:hypothetical protein